MHFFSYQNDNRSSPRPKKSWHFRKRGQQRYKKKKVERRNASDLLNKMIKCDFNDDNYERIKKIKNIDKIENNDCKKRNGSAKTLRERHLKRKTYKKPVGKSGWAVFHGPTLTKLCYDYFC